MASKTDKTEDKDEKPADAAEGGGGGEASAEGGDSGKKKMPIKKILLFVGAPLILLIGAGAGLYFTGMLDGLLGKKAEEATSEDPAADGEHADEEASHAEGEEASGHGEKKAESHDKKSAKDEGGGHGKEGGKEGEGGSGLFVPIPTMIVNLNSDDGTPRYLRLTVQLEMASAEDGEAVKAVLPRVVDQFQTYLRELRMKDLRGSAGIYRLQMELLWRVNQAAAPVTVKDVLFQEILIQ